jgi:hypothetical protein
MADPLDVLGTRPSVYVFVKSVVRQCKCGVQGLVGGALVGARMGSGASSPVSSAEVEAAWQADTEPSGGASMSAPQARLFVGKLAKRTKTQLSAAQLDAALGCRAVFDLPTIKSVLVELLEQSKLSQSLCAVRAGENRAHQNPTNLTREASQRCIRRNIQTLNRSHNVT